jgi:hypothetical protein
LFAPLLRRTAGFGKQFFLKKSTLKIGDMNAMRASYPDSKKYEISPLECK